jgi:hypothetical protein
MLRLPRNRTTPTLLAFRKPNEIKQLGLRLEEMQYRFVFMRLPSVEYRGGVSENGLKRQDSNWRAAAGKASRHPSNTNSLAAVDSQGRKLLDAYYVYLVRTRE